MWKLLLLFARMRIGNFTQSEFEFESESRGLSLIRESGCCQTPTVVSGRDRDVDVAVNVGWGSLWHRLALPLGLPAGSSPGNVLRLLRAFQQYVLFFHSALFYFVSIYLFPLLVHKTISFQVIWSREDNAKGRLLHTIEVFAWLLQYFS